MGEIRAIRWAALLGCVSCVAAFACGGRYEEATPSSDVASDAGTDASDSITPPSDAADSLPVTDAGDAGDGTEGAPRKRIFITTASSAGNLGGLVGADAKCNTAAKAAGLAGTFVAWLSGAGKNAIDRVTGNGPWYDALGIDLIFTGKSTGANPLTGIAPATPITRNESGQVFTPAVGMWTGTTIGGVPPTPAYCLGDPTCDCGGWTTSVNTEHGFYAQSGQSGQNWSGAANINCSASEHLLCIEQ